MKKEIESTNVDILGVSYRIECHTFEEDSLLRFETQGIFGYCDRTTHLIVVADLYDVANEIDIKDIGSYLKQTLRHEIIHAFMFESGLGYNWEHKELGQEETTVDWIAIQFPKILKAFKEVKAL